MSRDTISVIVELPEAGDGAKGLFRGQKIALVQLPIEKLRDQMGAEAGKLLAILDTMPAKTGWRLDEAEVGVEISAEGGVSFIGTAKVGANATLKLKFKR